MSKRNRAKTTPANRPQPKTGAARTKTGNTGKIGFNWLTALLVGIVTLVLALLTVGGFLLLYHPGSATTPSTTLSNHAIGGVTCREIPQFVQKLKFSNSAYFSTAEPGVEGLILLDGATVTSGQNQQGQTYRDPSWSSAGFLAPLEFGTAGELFVAPAPVINVLDNPPERQNIVYRVDNLTGIMSQLLNLPRAAPPNSVNPFGVLGLGYDCDNAGLYVSSVAGSSRDKEVGRLYRLDTKKAAVGSQYDNVDAFGLAVFSGIHGKRLYYGLARYPEIWSLALDDKGNFSGQPRLEVSLANLGPRGSDKAREIKFVGGNQMEVHGIEFSFNLIAPTEKQETVYRFQYDRATDKWTLLPDNVK